MFYGYPFLSSVSKHMVSRVNSTMTSNPGSSIAQLGERWGRGFDHHLGRDVVLLSTKFHNPSCLVLVKPGSCPKMTEKLLTGV